MDQNQSQYAGYANSSRKPNDSLAQDDQYDPTSLEPALRQALDDIAVMAALPEGRRFLKSLMLESAALFQPVHNPTDPGGRGAAYLDGRRSIGLEVKAMCDRVGPQVFQSILAEASDH